jgi:uncharacterized Ntn-hydrolase superfamily protein
MPKLTALPLVIAALAFSLWPGQNAPRSETGQTPRPASYSILAYDPLTGEFGVAAASPAPLIGVNLEYFDKDAGAVVVHGGPFLQINEKALLALQEGIAPDKAIKIGLLGVEDQKERQVLVISPTGAAAFTGVNAPKHAADALGDDFIAAGIRLSSRKVVAAMKEAFEGSDGPLADRLLGALIAGTEAGGEEGGAHSAALVVVGAGARFASRDRLVDLRIDYVEGDAVAAMAQLRASIDSIYEVN